MRNDNDPLQQESDRYAIDNVRNDNDSLQQELDQFASEYPVLLNWIAEYFQKYGISIRELIEADSIDQVIDKIGVGVNVFAIQLAGLLKYWMNN